MDDRNNNAALRIALMGALTGGALGGGAKFLSGAKGIKEILKAMGIGGVLGGAAAGGTNIAGSAVMGEPTEGEEGAYAKRGLLGGALLGTVVGGGLGAAGAAGKLPGFLKAAASKLGDEIPIENMITRKIAEYGKAPTSEGIKKGAMLGGATLGIPLAYEGMDEGIYMDALQDQIEKEQRKKMVEQMIREQYGV